jgi:hypothetical protein
MIELHPVPRQPGRLTSSISNLRGSVSRVRRQAGTHLQVAAQVGRAAARPMDRVGGPH